jgi:hypothetical protein
MEMLRRGWSVLAIDGEAEAIERLRERASGIPALETQVASFEAATWPEVDLLNAGFSLPFCSPASFDGVWERIRASLREGGRFSGHFFGDRDGWVGEKELTFHTRDQALGLLAGLDLERFEEEETDGRTALGEPKHWHIFHVIARRE